MSLSDKSVLIAVIPVLITAVASVADNAVKWRAEMDQKRYDRQTRLIDRLMEIEKAEDRLGTANFYLELGVFDGAYKRELNLAIETTIAQINKTAREEAEKKRIADEQARRLAKVESSNKEYFKSPPKSTRDDSDISFFMPPPEEIVVAPVPEEPIKEKEPLKREDLPTIFSFDR